MNSHEVHARLGGRVSSGAVPIRASGVPLAPRERPVKLNSNGHVATWRTTVRHPQTYERPPGDRHHLKMLSKRLPLVQHIRGHSAKSRVT